MWKDSLWEPVKPIIEFDTNGKRKATSTQQANSVNTQATWKCF